MNLYQVISNELKSEILNGTLKPGDRMLSVNQIKEKYSVSHITALRVYRELTAEGVVQCRRGQGYFVRDTSVGQHKIFGRLACFVRTMRPPRDDDNYFNEINIGIQLEAANRRIDLFMPHNAALLNALACPPEKQEEIRNAMLACADGVDGFLLDERIDDRVISELISETRKPAVIINRRTELPINTVFPDNENALRTILDMGGKMKYTRFLFCAKSSPGNLRNSDFNSQERDRIFRSLAVDENWEVIENALMVPRDLFIQKVREAYERHRKKGRVLVICTSDVLAATLISGFQPGGGIPEDLGIAGLEGLDVRKQCDPGITAARIDTVGMGMKAVEILHNSVNGTGFYTPSTVMIKPAFTPGGSMF